MTTANGKKTPKNPKTGKAPVSRGRRKKVVAKAPAPAEIDKQKMAAFFSAAGLDKTAPDSGTEVESVAVKGSKKSEPAESGKPVLVESTSVPAAASEPPAKEPENAEVAAIAKSVEVSATAGDNPDDIDNNSEKGETLMATTEKTTTAGSGSGSYNLLPMFAVLLLIALFWLYYISSTPLKKAAEVQVEQGKAEISVLMAKVKGLEAEVAGLKIKLVLFEKAAMKWKNAAVQAVKASAQVKRGVVSVKKVKVKAISKDKPKAATAVKKGSSFDKAPIPFWRNMNLRPSGSLIKPPVKKVKPEVKAPAVKVDSFSKAPKPFWLTPRVKPTVAKTKKQVIISAPPAAKAASQAKKRVTQQKPASAPILGSSFDKAPKPFWLKD
ncbi:MAG: hypothetical protein J7L25_03095 [Deltaproteobacteria bacterium]|nr:hypothetical protein [Candidatus Tharpella aukensis]